MSRRDLLSVIHYSCESFDAVEQRSGRITSIAVLNVGTGSTESFAIHQVADELLAANRRKRIAEPLDAFEDYSILEKAILDRFADYLRANPNRTWIHWNMRDVTYGFQAIELRSRVVGARHTLIPESQRLNLAELLTDIYGPNYMWQERPHGRLENTMRYNKITDLDFLRGAEEGEAFERGEFVRLHRSTLRKVRVIQTIAERASDGSLRTQASFWDEHGAEVNGVIDAVMDHPLYKVIALIFAAIGFVGSVVGLVVAIK